MIRPCRAAVSDPPVGPERACAEIPSLGISAVDSWHVRGWCEHLARGPGAVAATLQLHGLGLEAVSAYNTPLSEGRAWLPVAAGLPRHAVVTGGTPPETWVLHFAAPVPLWVARATERGVRPSLGAHGHAAIGPIAATSELTRLLFQDGHRIAVAPIHPANPREQTADAGRALRHRLSAVCVSARRGVSSYPICLTNPDNCRSCRPCPACAVALGTHQLVGAGPYARE